MIENVNKKLLGELINMYSNRDGQGLDFFIDDDTDDAEYWRKTVAEAIKQEHIVIVQKDDDDILSEYEWYAPSDELYKLIKEIAEL